MRFFPSATQILVQELDDRFPQYKVMSAFGVLYLQFWCQGDTEELFDKNLHILMDTYGHEIFLSEGDKKMLLKPLTDHDALISQRALFKTCMKSN